MQDFKEKMLEFGNPAAFYENRLYHLFCQLGMEKHYYRTIYYGEKSDELDQVKLNKRLSRLLSKIVRHQRNRINFIMKHINYCDKSGPWLDMGCGVGQFINEILKKSKSFVVGSEVSYNSLKIADSLLLEKSLNKRYALVNQDPFTLPFKDGSFDYILSADVFEHVGYENQKKILSEILRVLKTDGFCIIHTPNLNRVRITTIFKKIYFAAQGFNPLRIKHHFHLDHSSLSSADRLKKVCYSIGAEVNIFYHFKWKFYEI